MTAKESMLLREAGKLTRVLIKVAHELDLKIAQVNANEALDAAKAAKITATSTESIIGRAIEGRGQ